LVALRSTFVRTARLQMLPEGDLRDIWMTASSSVTPRLALDENLLTLVRSWGRSFN